MAFNGNKIKVLTRKEFKASILATVLVVSTLMLLGVLFVLTFWEMDLVLSYRFHYSEQQRSNVESGFLLYTIDSTLMARAVQDSTVLLYEDDESSRISINRKNWGLYEIVNVSSGNGKYSSWRLVGKAFESDKKVSLYIPENHLSLSLSGMTYIEGLINAPANGIAYTQVRSEFYKGDPIEIERVKPSESKLPDKDEYFKSFTENLFEFPEETIQYDYEKFYNSFDNPALYIESINYLSNAEMAGNIILISGEEIYIDASNELNNIIVIAPSVYIEEGFRGSIQVFARDTIALGDNVKLGSGSGLFCGGEERDKYVYVGDNCEVNGYVIVENCRQRSEGKKANYFQSFSAKVRGLVYVDGFAELHGVVTGSVYAKDSYYFAPEGYYTGLLYDLTILENPESAFPFVMSGPYERKVIKWLE